MDILIGILIGAGLIIGFLIVIYLVLLGEGMGR